MIAKETYDWKRDLRVFHKRLTHVCIHEKRHKIANKTCMYVHTKRDLHTYVYMERDIWLQKRRVCVYTRKKACMYVCGLCVKGCGKRPAYISQETYVYSKEIYAYFKRYLYVCTHEKRPV